LHDHYETDEDDVINDFYVPVLSNSTKYLRLVGYFNSGSLSLLSKGLKEFILNGSKMKLVCGSVLNKNDVQTICESTKSIEDIISVNLIEELERMSIDNNSENFDNLKILGWMISHDLLEIKIAVKLDENNQVTSDGILHAKVGILEDFEGNQISFSGSNNETAAALKNNFEYFDVCNSWTDSSHNQLKGHLKTFNKYWEETIDSYKILSVPEAVEHKLISYAPQKFEELKFPEDKKYNKKKKNLKPQLFDYQLEARESWFNKECKGIFAMATGTGKTFTSLGCLEKVLEVEKKVLTVIAVPYMHLVQQWKDSIAKYGLNDKIDSLIIADSSNHKWKQQMADAIYEVDFDIISNAVIITTHKTASSKNFINLITEDKLTCKMMLIADEMHALGSYQYRLGLLDVYEFRLGLSATPERVFDDIGTNLLKNYFGDIIYSFSLEKALKTINPLTGETYLTPYNYYPCFVNLSIEDLRKYKEFTDKIIKIKYSKNIDDDSLENLYRKRADILKNARDKYDVLRELLSKLGSDIKNMIIYCSPQQIKEVVHIAGEEYGLNVRKFTSKESAKIEEKWDNKSEREVILERFSEGKHQCLIAMKCLDEGVDVPSASNAILMSNSTNPREFIQRLGRVIRRYPNKKEANIYDFMIKPQQHYDDLLKNIEDDIYNKELKRSEQIVKLAKNKEIKSKIYLK